MRIGIISDIHGNAVALEAVLADLGQNPVDQLVCLGDAIQGGPQPAQVVEHLRRLKCPVVMGNADAWLLTGVETGAETFSAERTRKNNAIREWSLTQLSPADREFIAAFQPTVTIALTGELNLLCFHGSPTSFDDIIFPSTAEEDVQRLLGGHAPHILTGGHTHLQQIRRLGDAFFFNPGSVGYAYSHTQTEDNFRADPWADYAVLTVDNKRSALEFRKVPFESASLIQVYQASGRPFSTDGALIYRAGP